MTRRCFGLVLAMGLVGIGILFIGCSTPETRAKKSPKEFGQLSKTEKAKVLKGEIAEGMGYDAVYIALGRPSRKTSGKIDGKSEERWIYGRLETDTVHSYRPRSVRFRDGRSCYYSEFYPEYVSYYVDSFEVIFENGKVSGWRQL